MKRKKEIIDWDGLSKFEMVVMLIMVPIFGIVAGVESIGIERT